MISISLLFYGSVSVLQHYVSQNIIKNPYEYFMVRFRFSYIFAMTKFAVLCFMM